MVPRGKIDNISLGVYRDKTVLVTGHTGFVGGWLSLWLKELGAKVVGYSLEPPTKPSFFESTNLGSKIDSHNVGDVRDYQQIIDVFQKYQPEIVFHLAAQPLVRLSYREPKLTYETNVIGTVNVLEAVRKTGSVKVCVVVTSDKCYENKEWLFGYREIDPIGGFDPYSSSKGCAELVTTAYRRSFFNIREYGRSHAVSISSVRAGNIIGGGDWSQDRIIPDCVKALCRDKTIFIRNPRATRPWQLVLEPLSGCLWLGALMYRHGSEYSDAWNFGPTDGAQLSVEELVCLFLKQWGGGKYEIRKTDQLHEGGFLKLDTSKVSSTLKWESVYSVFDAVAQAAIWYKTFYFSRDKNICDFTLSQIGKYVEKAKENGLLWAKGA
jgi:CDP-glucose 4,6-dehydratase